MGDIMYCTLCLVTDVKMFKMSPKMFSNYSEIIPTHNLCMEKMCACYECAYLLRKYGEFKEKCLTAYCILQSYIDGCVEVTEQWLKNIDRKQSKLASKLTNEHCTNVIIEYYVPDYQKEINNLDNIPLVKTETFANNSEKQDCDFITKQLQPIIEICPEQYVHDILGNSDKTELYAAETKIELFVTSTQCDEDNFHTENIFEANPYLHDNMNEINNDRIEEDLKLQSTQIVDAHNVMINHKRKPHISDCDVYSDSDIDNTELKQILARYPLKRKSKCNEENKSKIKRQKCTSQNKRNTNKKVVTEKIMLKIEKIHENTENKIQDKIASDINRKLNSKGSSIRNKKIKRTVSKKSNKNAKYSLDLSNYDNYATIIELTPEDARREVLLRKESKNYKTSLYRCELCYRGFMSEATFQSHMIKHSLEHGSYECDTCKLRFTSKGLLRGHQLSCHRRKFLCKKCPYSCHSCDQFRNHISLHKGKEFICKDCGQKFRYPNSLSSHIRITHDLDLACDLCGSPFASAKGLEIHKNMLHKKEKNEYLGPKCDECDVHFSTELAWKRHLVLCSKHKVSNGCSVCGEIFPDASSLRSHARSHGAQLYAYRQKPVRRKPHDVQLPAACVHCDKQISNKKMYKTHMTTEHPDTDIAKSIMKTQQKKCVCEVCGMMFKHPSFLVQHQRKHTGEKPFSCPECGKGFKTKHAMTAHQPVHTNMYPYKCHICSRAFGDRGRLNKHLKYHSADRPHKCTACERTFVYQCDLKSHAMYVHDKVPWPKRDRGKRKTAKEEKY